MFTATAIVNPPSSGTYTLKSDGTIDFRSYPQTKVTDSSLVNSLTIFAGTKPTSSNSGTWTSYKYYIGNGNSNSGTNTTDFMWYKDISYGGNKYRAVYFTSYRPYRTSYSSSTDKTKEDFKEKSVIDYVKLVVNPVSKLFKNL